METILKEYNKFSATRLSTMQELEEVSEIVHSDFAGATSSEIFFRRFYSCCAEDKCHHLHHIYYYSWFVGKLDKYGDTAGDLAVVEYGLLRQ